MNYRFARSLCSSGGAAVFCIQGKWLIHSLRHIYFLNGVHTASQAPIQVMLRQSHGAFVEQLPRSRPMQAVPPAVRVESAPGVAPRAAHRTGREPLDSSGSCHQFEGYRLPSKYEGSSCASWPDSDVGDPPPSLHDHYNRFITTTGQSAPDRCIGTFGLMGSPLAPFPFSPPTRFSSSTGEPK
jgi:hypothetical protein